MIQRIPINDIVADPNENCRLDVVDVDENALTELVASIRQHGLIHQLNVRLVDGRPHLVTGFRRLMACKILGWTEVPCRILDATDEQAKFINLAENLARADLNPVEEARALEKLFPAAEFSSRAAIIGQKLCRSQTWIVSRRQIRRLSPAHQQHVAAGRIPISRVAEILAAKYPDDVAQKIVAKQSTKPRATRGKGVRGRRAIRNMIATLRAAHLDGLPTRCLEWASGQISTEELTLSMSNRPIVAFNAMPGVRRTLCGPCTLVNGKWFRISKMRYQKWKAAGAILGVNTWLDFAPDYLAREAFGESPFN